MNIKQQLQRHIIVGTTSLLKITGNHFQKLRKWWQNSCRVRLAPKNKQCSYINFSIRTSSLVAKFTFVSFGLVLLVNLILEYYCKSWFFTSHLNSLTFSFNFVTSVSNGIRFLCFYCLIFDGCSCSRHSNGSHSQPHHMWHRYSSLQNRMAHTFTQHLLLQFLCSHCSHSHHLRTLWNRI